MKPTPGKREAARKSLDAMLKAKMKRTFSNAYSPGHFFRRAYNAVPVPESRKQSHYHNQLQRAEAGLAKRPKRP